MNPTTVQAQYINIQLRFIIDKINLAMNLTDLSKIDTTLLADETTALSADKQQELVRTNIQTILAQLKQADIKERFGAVNSSSIYEDLFPILNNLDDYFHNELTNSDKTEEYYKLELDYLKQRTVFLTKVAKQQDKPFTDLALDSADDTTKQLQTLTDWAVKNGMKKPIFYAETISEELKDIFTKGYFAALQAWLKKQEKTLSISKLKSTTQKDDFKETLRRQIGQIHPSIPENTTPAAKRLPFQPPSAPTKTTISDNNRSVEKWHESRRSALLTLNQNWNSANALTFDTLFVLKLIPYLITSFGFGAAAEVLRRLIGNIKLDEIVPLAQDDVHTAADAVQFINTPIISLMRNLFPQPGDSWIFLPFIVPLITLALLLVGDRATTAELQRRRRNKESKSLQKEWNQQKILHLANLGHIAYADDSNFSSIEFAEALIRYKMEGPQEFHDPEFIADAIAALYFGHKKIEPPDPKKWKKRRSLKKTGHKKAERLPATKPTTLSRQLADRLLADLPGDSKFQAKFLTQLKKATPKSESQNLRRIAYNIAFLRPETYTEMKMDTLVDAITLLVRAPTWQQQKTAADFLSNFSFSHLDTLRNMIVHLWDNNGTSEFRGLFAEMLNAIEKTNADELACDIFVQKIFAAFLGNPLDGWIRNRYSKMDSILAAVMQTVDIHKSRTDTTPGYAFIYEDLVKKAFHSKFAYLQSAAPTRAGAQLQASLLKLHENQDNYLQLLTFLLSPRINPDAVNDFAFWLAKRFSESLHVVKKENNEHTLLLDDSEDPSPEIANARKDLITAYLDAGNDAKKILLMFGEDEFATQVATVISLIDSKINALKNSVTPLSSSTTPPKFADADYQDYSRNLEDIYQNPLLLTTAETRLTVTIPAIQRVLAADGISEIDRGLLLQILIRTHLANKVNVTAKQNGLITLLQRVLQSITLTETQKDKLVTTLFYSTVDDSRKPLPIPTLFKQLFSLTTDEEENSCNRFLLACHKTEYETRTAQAKYFLHYRDPGAHQKTIERMLNYAWDTADEENKRASCFDLATNLLQPVLAHEGKKIREQQIILSAQIIRAYSKTINNRVKASNSFGDFELQRWALEHYPDNSSAKAIFAEALNLAIKDIALKKLKTNFQIRAEHYFEAAKYLVTLNNEHPDERKKYLKKLEQKFKIFCIAIETQQTDLKKAYHIYAEHFRMFQQETTGILQKALKMTKDNKGEETYAELCIAEQIFASAKKHSETIKRAEDFTLLEIPLPQAISSSEIPNRFNEKFPHAAKLLPLLKLDTETRHTTLASSFRSVPGLANFSNHKFTTSIQHQCYYRFNLGPEVRLCSSRYRSSLIVPPPSDVSEVESRITIGKDNINRLIEITHASVTTGFSQIWHSNPKKIVLAQTLLSPITPPVFITRAVAGKNNDETTMNSEKNIVIRRCGNEHQDTIFINTNYMLNKMRTFSKLKRDDIEQLNTINKTLVLNQIKSFIRDTVIPNLNDGGCKTALDPLTKTEPQNWKAENMQAVLDAFNDNNNLSEQQKLHLALLINAAKDYLDIDKQQAENDRHRELFVASLEQIIVENIGGIAYGSCKSGKDRKGCEVLHTDAMQLYFARYGQLPRYNDNKEDRQKFIAIFATLFFSEHQQEVADFNAPGANGIKNLVLLPKDIFEYLSVNPRFLVYKLSSNLNKPKIKQATPVNVTDFDEENAFIDSLLNILQANSDNSERPDSKSIKIFEGFILFTLKIQADAEKSRVSKLADALMIVSISEILKTKERIDILTGFWAALTDNHTQRNSKERITEDLGNENNLNDNERIELAIVCQAHLFSHEMIANNKNALQNSLTALKEFSPITHAQRESNNYSAYTKYFQYLFANLNLTDKTPSRLFTELLNMVHHFGYEKDQVRISILHGYLRALYTQALKDCGDVEIENLEDLGNDNNSSIIPQLHHQIEPIFIDGLYTYLSQPMSKPDTHLASLECATEFLEDNFAPFAGWLKNIALMAELRSLALNTNKEQRIAEIINQLNSFISANSKNYDSKITIEEFSATGKTSHISLVQLMTTFFVGIKSENEKKITLNNLLGALITQNVQTQIIQRIFVAYIIATNKKIDLLDNEQLKAQINRATSAITIRIPDATIFASNAIENLLQAEINKAHGDDEEIPPGSKRLASPISSGFFAHHQERVAKTIDEFTNDQLSISEVNSRYMYEDSDIERIRELFIDQMLPIGQRGYRDGNNLLLKYATDAIKTIAILPAISESAARHLSPANDFKVAFQQIKNQESGYPARILFNINTGNHWILGEVNITRNAENQINIEMTAHNPYGGGKMPKVIQGAIKEAFSTKYPNAPFTTPESIFSKRQHDGTSCGAISVQDLMHRIQNEPLTATGAKTLRLSHLELCKEYDTRNAAYQFYYKQFNNIQKRLLSYRDLSAQLDQEQKVELENIIQIYNAIRSDDSKQTFADNLFAAIIKQNDSQLATSLRGINITDNNRALIQLLLTEPGNQNSTIKANIDVIRIAGLIIFYNTYSNNVEKLQQMHEMLKGRDSFYAQGIYNDYKEIMLQRINEALRTQGVTPNIGNNIS